jgi:hypothetical protein
MLDPAAKTDPVRHVDNHKPAKPVLMIGDLKQWHLKFIASLPWVERSAAIHTSIRQGP